MTYKIVVWLILISKLHCQKFRSPFLDLNNFKSLLSNPRKFSFLIFKSFWDTQNWSLSFSTLILSIIFFCLTLSNLLSLEFDLSYNTRSPISIDRSQSLAVISTYSKFSESFFLISDLSCQSWISPDNGYFHVEITTC